MYQVYTPLWPGVPCILLRMFVSPRNCALLAWLHTSASIQHIDPTSIIVLLLGGNFIEFIRMRILRMHLTYQTKGMLLPSARDTVAAIPPRGSGLIIADKQPSLNRWTKVMDSNFAGMRKQLFSYPRAQVTGASEDLSCPLLKVTCWYVLSLSPLKRRPASLQTVMVVSVLNSPRGHANGYHCTRHCFRRFIPLF